MVFYKLSLCVAITCAVLLLCLTPHVSPAEETPPVIAELNAFWTEVSRSVKAGDFKGYAATCHPDGVLVSGVKKNSQPLQEALARWKPGIDDTRAGKMKADVQFRFTARLTGKTTAHETGIFRYTSQLQDAEPKVEYIHFEALLVKQDGKWLTMMEYQKSKATLAQWQAALPRRKKRDIR